MATKWAIANGNWSDSSTWNDSIVPSDDDDVYFNGYNVTQNIQTITCSKISNRAFQDFGINAGGALVRSNTTPGNMTYLNANVECGTGTICRFSVNYKGFIINGDVIKDSNDGTFAIVGGDCVYTGRDFIINGNCVGNVLSCRLYGSFQGNTYFIQINGNYTGNIRITSYYADLQYAENPIIINGDFTPQGNCIIGPYDVCHIYGEVHNDYAYTLEAGLLYFYSTQNLKFPKCFNITTEYSLALQLDSGLVLYSSSTESLNYPQPTFVSYPTKYGLNNEYEGELQLPPEGAVLKDVTYGGKTGTLEVIALSGATATADNISVVNLTEQELNRVKNCATVSTVQKCFEDFKEE